MFASKRWFGLLMFCSFLLLGSAAIPTAQSATLLRGTVTDATGGVIQGAVVQLIIDGRTALETKTGNTGEFELAVPADAGPKAQYQVLAAASGFAPVMRPVQLAQSGTQRLDFTLEVAPYRQALEIHASMPENQSLLDMSGVRESSAKDLGEALTSLDGVWKIRKAGIANDLVIRGFQQNNINLLVDGSRTYGACPNHMDPPAQHVDFAEVDHVEVSKGAFDVANQGSLGAVVNIVTKSPGLGFSLKPSMSLGSFGFYNPSITASYGNHVFRVLGGYSFRTSEPYRDGSGRRFTDYAPYSASGKQQQSFDVNTAWIETEFSLTDRQQLSLGYTRQQAGLILYPYLKMDSDHDNADRGTFRYTVQNVTPLVRNVRVEGYFTQVKHFMSDTQRTSAMMGNWMMAADAATQAIGGRVETDLGRDFTTGFESYHRNWNMTNYMRMSGVIRPNPAIPNVDTQTLGSYVNYQHSITDRLRVSAGFRFDHAEMRAGASPAPTDLYYQFHNTRRTSNDDNYVSGNGRITLTLPKSNEVFAGVGTTGRIPDAEERYFSRSAASGVFVGNPLLPITRNTEVSAGWSLNRNRFYVRPEFFYSVLNNFIVVNNQPQLNALGTGGMGMTAAPTARSYANVDARMYGGEAAYGVTLTSTLSLNGGGSYTRGTLAPVPAANVFSRNLPEIPPLRAWSALRYARPWMFAEIGSTAANRQSLVNADLKEVPTAGYALMNAKLGLTYRKLSASFTIDNLLDRFYYEHLSYYRDPFAAGVKIPEPGRNFFVQVRYSF